MNTTLGSFYDVLRYGVSGGFVALHAAIMTGVLREHFKDSRTMGDFNRMGNVTGELASSAELPLVSVIIPVHNEVARLGPLLQSLLLQDYPFIEIVFVDDRSTDGTIDLLRAFADNFKSAGHAVNILQLESNPGPNYKQFGLNQGILAATGTYLALTDADCEVPSTWVRGMAARLADTDVGLVVGPVFKRIGGPGFFYLLQAFDHAIRVMYVAGASGIGAAGGAFGNNMIVRKTALDAVGGYQTVPFSVTEDAALVARIKHHSPFLVRTALGAEVRVMTQEESNWPDFVKQTLRWNNGGLYSPDWTTRLNYNLMVIVICAGILAMPLLPFVPSLWPFTAAVMLAMVMNTSAVFLISGQALPRFKPAYLVQLVFSPIYITYLTLLGYFGAKVYWKGNSIQK